MVTGTRLIDDDDLGLPAAELAAARLDGDLVPLGFSFVPVDAPSRARSRAASLRPRLPDRFIADRRSAAWVYGATERLPERFEACVSTASRPSALSLFNGSVREVVIADEEVVRLGGVLVTSRLRTIIDLLRTPVVDDGTASIARRLAAQGGVTLADCDHYLAERAHLPWKRAARSRIAEAFSGLSRR